MDINLLIAVSQDWHIDSLSKIYAWQTKHLEMMHDHLMAHFALFAF